LTRSDLVQASTGVSNPLTVVRRRTSCCPGRGRDASADHLRYARREAPPAALVIVFCFTIHALCPAVAAETPSPSVKTNQVAQEPASPTAGGPQPGSTESVGDTFFIKEFRVEGVESLRRIEVEAAVYPFLGPGRTSKDVEMARAALEKAYLAAGFQTVGVEIPQQEPTGGIVHLRVVERAVGRLRVKGAVYSSPRKIKAMAPSIAEGKVINFNNVPHDIIALNQLPDRRVTPSLHPGVDPDTVDIDLQVKETLPIHASVELNNRYGPNTKPLRLDASVSDNDLWQLGHAISFSYQVSPQDTSEVKVYSGYYLARFRGLDWLSFLVQGTKQNSNVSTLGDVAVAGRGDTLGIRAIVNLPQGQDFTDSASFGVDYKKFDQTISVSPAASIVTPVAYYPLSASYSATWIGKGRSTELNSGVTFTLRGFGNKQAEFANSRYNSDGGFIFFHGDLSHTEDLPHGFQVFAKVQGQVSDKPLLSSDEASGGGLGTVRGYLEAEVVGDNAGFGSVELRSPSLMRLIHQKSGDWRIYAFCEGGFVTLEDPLPEQTSIYRLASYGLGSRVQILDHFDGSINVGIPHYDQAESKANDVRVTFRAALDY